MKRPHKVRVFYKGGQTIDVKCTSFTVSKNVGGITAISWEDASPNPLHIGVDEIAAIWEIV